MSERSHLVKGVAITAPEQSSPAYGLDAREPGTIGAWHCLMDDAFVRLWWSDDQAVTVEFDTTAALDIRQRLLDLVRAERQSHGSLNWQLRRVDTHLRLRVAGQGAADTVAALMY